MMIKKLMISALLLGASVCHAVTIGAQSATPVPKTGECCVQPKKTSPTQVKKGHPATAKKKQVTTPKVAQVKHHHHHHHYYHYPKKPVGRMVRREVHYRPYHQPVRVRSYRPMPARVVYPAPVVRGAGIQFTIR